MVSRAFVATVADAEDERVVRVLDLPAMRGLELLPCQNGAACDPGALAHTR
jgi:hypothetical protein